MLIKKRITLAAYIVSILIYSTLRISGRESLAVIAQPFMLITLWVYYMISTKKLNYSFLLALLFTLIGSLFFLNHTLERFMLALALIFIANQFFLLTIVHRMRIFKLKDMFLVALPIYILLMLLVYFYFEVDTTIKIFLFIYAFSLTLLGTFAFLHYKNSKKQAALLMLFGVFFMIARDFFTGLSRLLQIDDYYYFIPSIIPHALAMYLACRSVILADNKRLESKAA